MGENLVQIGKIVNTHGLKGELKVYPLTDFPERYNSLKEIFLITAEKSERLLIEKVRFQKGHIFIKFKGYDTIGIVEGLKGSYLGIPEDQLCPLGRNEYYQFQIIGLSVYTEEGRYLGIIEEIFPTGSNDVYVIRGGDKEYLIPAIHEVIREVNLETKRMIIHPQEGLFDSADTC